MKMIWQRAFALALLLLGGQAASGAPAPPALTPQQVGLPASLLITVTVTAGKDGPAVEDQPIVVYKFPDGHAVRTAVTDVKGQFQLLGLPIGQYFALAVNKNAPLPPLKSLFTLSSKRIEFPTLPLYKPEGGLPLFSVPVDSNTLALQNSLLSTLAAPVAVSATPPPATGHKERIFFVTDRAIRGTSPLAFDNAPTLSNCNDPLSCFTYGTVDYTGAASAFLKPAGPPYQRQLLLQLENWFAAHPGVKHEIVLWVHGCCTNFDGGMGDGRIIANGVGGTSSPLTMLPVVAYSYPSSPNAQFPNIFNVHFFSDETETVWTYPHLTELIHALLTSTAGTGLKINTIHFIAHSLGNRVLFPALELLQTKYPADKKPKIGNVFFIAPDIDLTTFQEAAVSIASIAKNVTIYRSDIDHVIGTSRWLHQHDRLGYIEYPNKPPVSPVTVIDASTFLCLQNVQYASGHFYWKASPIAYADVRQALLGVPPNDPRRKTYLISDKTEWRFSVVPGNTPDGGCLHTNDSERLSIAL